MANKVIGRVVHHGEIKNCTRVRGRRRSDLNEVTEKTWSDLNF